MSSLVAMHRRLALTRLGICNIYIYSFYGVIYLLSLYGKELNEDFLKYLILHSTEKLYDTRGIE